MQEVEQRREQLPREAKLLISGLDSGRQPKWKQWAESNYQVDCYLIGPVNGNFPGILREYRTSEPATAWVCQGAQCLPAESDRVERDKDLECWNWRSPIHTHWP